MIRLRFSALLLIVATALLLGSIAHAFWRTIVATNIWSNRHALETGLRGELTAYHLAHGRYQDSLDGIKIDRIHTPARRLMLLKPFYYENRGASYVLWWPADEPWSE